MRLLDLFCGAGGCSVGYHRAGFDVVGVDIRHHPDYPYPQGVADAMDILTDQDYLAGFDVIHASPPCPFYSEATPNQHRDSHPDLIGPVREKLQAWGGLYIIENVPGAGPWLDHPLLICGSGMGLGAHCRDGRWRPLRRHRLFESNAVLMSYGCLCDGREKLGVTGTGGGGKYASHNGYKGHPEEQRAAMGIDWMTSKADLVDAIPPAYTEYLGEQLITQLARAS